MTAIIEEVVLLDENNKPVGVIEKARVHHQQTPLHLAFSCYILNDKGQILLTRRSLNKKAWPGVWTNSVCGHPLPGEPMAAAVTRRCQYELGLQVQKIEMLLPEFSYVAQDASGIMENEFCPVFKAYCQTPPAPLADEVMDWHWVNLSDLLLAVSATPWAFSPWMVAQLKALEEAGHIEAQAA
ncbi:isopentenyl-diphosphate Delta-isomerase [Gallaecimonas mangrovi]|uniref:isopentenyl-diphosphate Delta-isomerase n=1 Tax=Gallaecimonas mangrovi TaxID=2291597 RepID=UPI000E209605|nr:isopentenyl-diphosphate Delta-isomerase [Gallaecimonas mangrovi]